MASSHETPLTRAMWQVHMRLSKRTDQQVDAEVAEEIARTAIAQYLDTLAGQNQIRLGYEPNAGERWTARAVYPEDLKRMVKQTQDAGFVGPCPPGKEPHAFWGTADDF